MSISAPIDTPQTAFAPPGRDVGGAVPAGQRPPAFWSVVVIARNEEATVAACLISAREALGARAHELLLIDSASTDGTAAAAERVGGVRIVTLPASAPLGPALGRYAGQQVATGDWLLFLDGDMVLLPGWVDAAERALAGDASLVGLAGELEHSLSDAGGARRRLRRQDYPDSDYRDAAFLGGSALYRRDALERAGGFNPYLRASEEEELGARLRKAGYRLRRLRAPMSRHHPKHHELTMAELWRRIGRGYYQGAGQLARHAISHRLPVRRPLLPISRHLAFFTLLLLGAACLAVALTGGGWRWLLLWALAMAGGFLLFVWRAGNLRKPAYYYVEWLLASPSVVRGLLRRPRPADEFAPVWRAICRIIGPGAVAPFDRNGP